MTIEQHGRTYRWRAMASPVELQLPDLPETLGLAVARAVARDLEETEQALSRFRQGAEFVRLNERVGDWSRVSWRLYAALSASWRAFRRTGGLFDPRVLTRLEEIGYAGVVRKAAPERTDPHWLLRRPRDRMVRIGAPLDLGGIGKGLGVRWAARIVRRLTDNYLLNAGGDLLAEGLGPDGAGWRVGVEDPKDPSEILAVLEVRARVGICTSSVGRLHWRHGGEEVHHLIDPRTGKPGGGGLLAVTVAGRDPAWAEVTSKALFLEGAERIFSAAARMPALWVLGDGTAHLTGPMADLAIWRQGLAVGSGELGLASSAPIGDHMLDNRIVQGARCPERGEEGIRCDA
jgi:thiamine biosynthesis lipoprotein